MDISNVTSGYAHQNLSQLSTNEAPMERTDLNNNCWQDNAADAIHQAFSNMDDFVSTFKDSALFDEA